MSWRQLLWTSNLLSLSRVALLWPLTITLADPDTAATIASVAILVIAGLTDFLDGYLARKLNQITPLGVALDPITDKIFAAGFMILLIVHRDFPFWLAAILIVRDLLLMFGGLLLLRQRSVTIPARLFGKYLFFATVILLGSFVIRYEFGQILSIILVLGLCAGSLIDYALIFRKVLRGQPLPAYDPKPGYKKIRVGATVIVLAAYAGVWVFQLLR